MRRFVLDTNVLLAYYRSNPLYERILKENNLHDRDVVFIMPVAVKAEILSIVKQKNWGEKKYNLVKKMVDQSYVVHTNDEITEAYVELDAYSQNNLKEKPLGMSPRNMGKNDLWIAATALVANATLITTDADFDHLNLTYLNVKKYPVER